MAKDDLAWARLHLRRSATASLVQEDAAITIWKYQTQQTGTSRACNRKAGEA